MSSIEKEKVHNWVKEWKKINEDIIAGSLLRDHVFVFVSFVKVEELIHQYKTMRETQLKYIQSVNSKSSRSSISTAITENEDTSENDDTSE